jgi:histidinol phosphatase-like PHP family hydrolase
VIDLHTHTLFSDGVLIPAELIRRAEYAGYSALALTDHADASNLEWMISSQLALQRETARFFKLLLLIGVELTHVPPKQVASLVRRARDFGAQLVVLHGETIAEPVAEGTNLAGIEAGVDILAHPGLISESEVKLAAERGVSLEISARPSHAMTNGLVAKLALAHNAPLVLDSDSHAPGDLLTVERRGKVASGAGLTAAQIEKLNSHMLSLVQKISANISTA